MIRHGDVMLKPIPKPDRDIPTNDVFDAITLMEGEKTGHSHVLHGPRLTLHRHWGNVIVGAPEGGDLRHQEHKTIAVPPGWYQVIRQRVYTPVGPRPVLD